MADHDSFFCPRCQAATSIERRARKEPNSGDLIFYEIGECNSCVQHFLVTRLLPSGQIVDLAPKTLPKPVDSAIPSPIKEDLEEAYRCFAAQAYRGAATMARRAMQNICLERGAPKTQKIKTKTGVEKEVKNDLWRQIDWLYNQRIITANLKDWAHEVRVIGNAGAHPADAEDQTPVTENDADDALSLVDAFCQPLYVAAEIYKKRQANVESLERS